MGASIEFNRWLVQPGNHRQLQGLRGKLQKILERNIEIHSWMDLYGVFEESVTKNENSRALFGSVFDVCPPTEESGATKKQIMLYRGATVNEEVLRTERHTKTVIYRGQKIERTVDVEKEKPAASQSDKPARYYRGALIK